MRVRLLAHLSPIPALLAHVFCTTSALRAEHPTAVALLSPLSLAGDTRTGVVWTELGSINSALAPASGSGSIAVHSPGFKASAGFYSFAGDYACTVASTPVSFGIKNVVLQLAGMVVSGTNAEGQELDYTPEDHLSFNGGPVLTYTHADGTGTLAPAYRGTLGGPVAGSGGGFDGDYYSFAWQWDLSALPANVTAVSIRAPLRAHSSTIGARLDLSDAFARLVGSPAPSALEQWRQTHFGSPANIGDAADGADPDHDGAPNLLEYALGRSPILGESAATVVLGSSEGRLTLSFNRIADAGLRYSVEATNELGSATGWNEIWNNDAPPVAAGTFSVTDTQLLSASSRRFLRLRVEVR